MKIFKKKGHVNFDKMEKIIGLERKTSKSKLNDRFVKEQVKF